jgi:hypothetical protein
MDSELNINQQAITANIDKILSRKSNSYRSTSRQSRTLSSTEAESRYPREHFSAEESSLPPDYDQKATTQLDEADNLEEIIPPKSPEFRARAISSPSEADLPRAPETQVRYFKAKLKMLEKQLEESLEARKGLNNQVSELQKSLKLEKDETKQLKKR